MLKDANNLLLPIIGELHTLPGVEGLKTCSFGLAPLFVLLVLLYPGQGFTESMPVFVTILPQKYFVEKVGGTHVQISVMVGPGANPHTYEPKPSQMAALSRAKAYFAIGVPFEKVWLKKFASANPRMSIVHSEEGIERIPMERDHLDREEDHRIGEGKENEAQQSGDIMDPHIWLSPPNVKLITGNVTRALGELDPAHRSQYEENSRKFLQEIDRLDREIREIIAGREGLKFMVFHPSWGYFARAYGLKQVPVEVEGKEPKAAQLRGLIEQARREGIKVVFAQPQFSTRSAETLAKAIGGQVVLADPLSLDWARNLKEQALKFKASLR